MATENPQVLIVDDEETLRKIVRKTLETHGYGCEEAADGAEGLAKVRGGRFALVLTDLRMPVMDGLSMIETVRRESPELPIIIMTGHADLKSARRAIQLGVVDYLLKPFDDLDQLVVATGRAIAERKERLKAGALARELEERVTSLEREEASLREQLEGVRDALRKALAEIAHADGVADEHVAKVASLIASARDALLITDLYGRAVAANGLFLKYLNAPSWKPAGTPLSRMPGERALREAVEELASSAAAGVETEALTTSVVGPDGEEVEFELSAAPLTDESGTTIGACTRLRPVRVEGAR